VSEVAATDSSYINEETFSNGFSISKSTLLQRTVYWFWMDILSNPPQIVWITAKKMELKWYYYLLTHRTPYNPCNKTVFKPINTYHHLEATSFMHNHPKARITKFHFWKLSSEQQLATLYKGLSTQTCFLVSLPLLPTTNFYLLIFIKFQLTPHYQTLQTRPLAKRRKQM